MKNHNFLEQILGVSFSIGNPDLWPTFAPNLRTGVPSMTINPTHFPTVTMHSSKSNSKSKKLGCKNKKVPTKKCNKSIKNPQQNINKKESKKEVTRISKKELVLKSTPNSKKWRKKGYKQYFKKKPKVKKVPRRTSRRRSGRTPRRKGAAHIPIYSLREMDARKDAKG